MDLILKQLGELVLGSVPTMILFILLVTAYGVLVRQPLERMLAERRARTTGAMEQARGAITAAEAETAVYEDKLRAAKGELFQAREARLKKLYVDREAALEGVRAATQAHVREARQGIEQGANAARGQIESMSTELSARVLSKVLPNGAASWEATQ